MTEIAHGLLLVIGNEMGLNDVCFQFFMVCGFFKLSFLFLFIRPQNIELETFWIEGDFSDVECFL